jgi:hypothetical protein
MSVHPDFPVVVPSVIMDPMEELQSALSDPHHDGSIWGTKTNVRVPIRYSQGGAIGRPGADRGPAVDLGTDRRHFTA